MSRSAPWQVVFASGLIGFGTGLPAPAFWLRVIGPMVAAPLVMVCSVIIQVQTLPHICHELDWRQLMPFIADGQVGAPVGTQLLTRAR